MRHKLFIQPRQTGKTKSIIDKFTDVDNLLVFNRIEKQRLIRSYGICQYNIHTFESLKTFLHLNGDLYIDEYFFLPPTLKKQLFNFVIMDNCTFNVEAYGTPNIQFDKKDVELVRYWWSCQRDRTPEAKILQSEIEMCNIFGEELLYNLIVCPTVDVKYWNKELNYQSKEHYEMECLGKIFKT